MAESEKSKLEEICRVVERFASRLAGIVVHLNDTYTVEKRAEGNLPGFARLIATVDMLRQCSTRNCGDDRVLVLHSGDFLGPSLLAKKDKGKTMVELMNRVGVDYVVPGNHELDHGQEAFLVRMKEASFKPLLANGLAPVRAKVSPYQLWPDKRRPWVAVTGLVGQSAQRAFGDKWSFGKSDAALKEFFADTQDSPFHLVLTHATRVEDLAIRDSVEFPRRTYILGGHDHDIAFADYATTPIIFKNLSNLKTVRVMVLIAGGNMGLDAVYGRYFAMQSALGVPPSDTPANREWLLRSSKAFDRDIVKRWINHRDGRIKPSGPEVPRMAQWSFSHIEAPHKNTLVWRLDGIPAPADMIWYLLGSADHAEADPESARIIESSLARHLPNLDQRVLRDLSTFTNELDATDDGLRSGPTDFGVMVANCVREFADADVAILNSGMFRSDAKLSPAITTLHLQEAFLFDNDNAIVVYHDFPSEWVDELIEGAGRAAGSGAFAQVSRRGVTPSRCTLAIASYVLESPECTDDCYLKFLASHWETVEVGREALMKRGPARYFGVVKAVEACIAKAPYPALDHTAREQADASKFIELARQVLVEFEILQPYTPERHAAWNTAFRKFLAGGKAHRHSAELDRRRDALRSFLLSVATRLPRGGFQRLQALREQVVNHRSRFEDDCSYHTIFDHAATGIEGWKP